MWSCVRVYKGVSVYVCTRYMLCGQEFIRKHKNRCEGEVIGTSVHMPQVRYTLGDCGR